MSARRSRINTKTRTRGKTKRMIEHLETRLLFNTIITDTNALTPTPDTVNLEYKDAKGVTVRIVVHGDVSAEFIFGRETKGDEKTGAGGNQLILGDAVAPTAVDDKGKTIANPEDGRDLFHVYIAQASIDSYISIAEVPIFSAKVRPMTPFTGAVKLTINPRTGTDPNRTMNGGTGNIYLGARTRDTAADIQDEADRPVVSARFNGQGLLPVTPNNRLIAGISTAPDVSIGRFLFGGAISGHILFQGSVESFYCGALLTGITDGQQGAVGTNQISSTTSGDPGNFYVAGDIRNILVKGSIGTAALANTIDGRLSPDYLTGTDFDIHGRVGQIKTGGDYLATGIIHNDNAGKGLRIRQQELEVRIDPSLNRGGFTEFENGQFGDNEPFFTNDSFNNAQFLGSINSKTLGDNTIQLNGLYQRVSEKVNDIADFYAVPLMAGQRITVRLIAPEILGFTGNGTTTQEFKSILHAGVFDPDQRLIASDYTNAAALTEVTPGTANTGGTGTATNVQDADTAQQELFSFVADRPGLYYIAVGESAPGFNTANTLIGIDQPYQLQLTGVGAMGLGALVADDTLFALGGLSSRKHSVTGFDAGMEVIHGDFGAIVSINDDLISGTSDVANALADGGDLRVVQAVSLGEIRSTGAADGSTDTTFGGAALIGAVTGSVGLIRSTSSDAASAITLINATGLTGNQFFPSVIGGDIQKIDAPNTLVTDLQCNGSIGVVQTGQFGLRNDPGSLSVNVDGKGKPGIIDLIDVTQNMGTLGAGGPVISTNAGGNVRYIHLADGSVAFRPRLFGGGQPESTTFVQGQEADITDDSGAQVRITPTIEDQTDANGNPILDANGIPLSNSGTLTLVTYPIARSPNQNNGAGGVVIVRIDCTRGVQVRTNGGSAEIGTINCGTADSGPGLIFGDTLNGSAGPDGIVGTGDDTFELDPNTTNHMGVDIKGALTDVFEVKGTNFESIRNRTGGEIVNTNIGTVGLLEGTSLGIARSSVRDGMAVEGSAVADNPGSAEIDGDTFPFLHAKNAIVINGGSESNPAAVDVQATQAIGNVMIVGRVQNIQANADGAGVKGVFEGIVGAIYTKGQIREVQIGEGLLPSGTGNMGRAGIYCAALNPSQTTGVGRIEEVVNQGLNSDIRGDICAESGIGNVELHDGSIINADIMVLAASGSQTAVHKGDGSDLAASEEFGSLLVVIGDIENVSVVGKGGIIGLVTESNNVGKINSIGGFGLINSTFSTQGAGRFGTVTADGYGIRGGLWDGGQSLDGLTALGDGHRLTTTSFEPAVLFSGSLAIDPFFGIKPGPLTDLFVVTHTTPDAPQKKGTSASGSIDLTSVALSRDIGFVRANTIRAAQFNIGNNANEITTSDYIDSLEFTSGRIGSISVGKDALRSSIHTSGPIGPVNIGGSFKGTSDIQAQGQNGTIASFTTGRSLYGNVYAQQSIGTIRVGTVYGSQGTRTAGNMTAFITNGDVVTGSILTVEKNLGKLTIGEDLEDGALIRVGTLGTKTIIGDEIGLIDIKPWGS